MKHAILGAALLAVLSACATRPTQPPEPDQIMTGRTQPLLVRTDPPGAACSLLQKGQVVASVESTPGAASIPRDFNLGTLYEPAPETIDPMVVLCKKEGFLEFRATASLAWSFDVALEERPRRDVSPAEVSPAESAGRVIGGVALVGAQLAATAALQAAAVAAPAATAAAAAVAGPIALGVVVVVAIANKDAPRPAVYAYRALPEFLLVPATFDSQSECDAFFATLKTKLEAAKVATHARIDAECQFPPCRASDPAPCVEVCERQRKRADAQLVSDLDQLTALRAQVRIVAAPD
jgi:hypothetical protein